MKIAVIGLGRMGHALAELMLDHGHTLRVWNRTHARADALAARGATVMVSPDDGADDTDAIFVCLSDDAAVLAVAAPNDTARSQWASPVVMTISTIAPDTAATLTRLYRNRFVVAAIAGAPQAVRSGSATFILGGPDAARQRLTDVWNLFAGRIDAGSEPARASVVKLLNNQLLLTGLAAAAETIRIGRGAGISDDVLHNVLRDSSMVAPGLHNRFDALFDPRHPGWFTGPLGAKDLRLAVAAANSKEPLPVTEAAESAYRRVTADGWGDTDIAAVVEYGSTR